MSKFPIFEDQENFQENPTAGFAYAKKDRQKLAPLKNKVINDENQIEKQVRKKNCASSSFCLFFTCYPEFHSFQRT